MALGKAPAQPQAGWLRLFEPGKVKIRRHVKVRGQANPLDPKWRDYFEARAFFKWFGVYPDLMATVRKKR